MPEVIEISFEPFVFPALGGIVSPPAALAAMGGLVVSVIFARSNSSPYALPSDVEPLGRCPKRSSSGA